MLDPNIELLQAVSLFRGLTEKQLRAILTATQKTFFQAGDELIAKDQIGNTAFLIMSGSARCFDLEYTRALDEILQRGTLIGELAMIVETVHAFSVRAVERVRALAIRRDALRAVMKSDAVIAQQISDNLVQRLRGLAGELRKFDRRLVAVQAAGLLDEPVAKLLLGA